MTYSLIYFLLSFTIMAYFMHVANIWIHNDKVSWNIFRAFSMVFAPIILPIISVVGIIFKLSPKRKQVVIRKISYNIGYNTYDLFFYLEIIRKAKFELSWSIEKFCDWVNYRFHHYTCRYKIQLELQNCHKKNIKPKYDYLMMKPGYYNYSIIKTIAGHDKISKEIFFGREDSCYGGFFFRFTAKRFAKKLRKELSSENIMIKNPYKEGNGDYASVNVKVIVPERVF